MAPLVMLDVLSEGTLGHAYRGGKGGALLSLRRREVHDNV